MYLFVGISATSATSATIGHRSAFKHWHRCLNSAYVWTGSIQTAALFIHRHYSYGHSYGQCLNIAAIWPKFEQADVWTVRSVQISAADIWTANADEYVRLYDPAYLPVSMLQVLSNPLKFCPLILCGTGDDEPLLRVTFLKTRLIEDTYGTSPVRYKQADKGLFINYVTHFWQIFDTLPLP